MYFGYLVPTEDINSVLPQLPQFTEEDNVEPSFFDALKYNIGFFSFLGFVFFKYFSRDKK